MYTPRSLLTEHSSFMLAAEKHKGTFLAPIGIGLALFVAELGSVMFTGGSLNPARSFGPDVVLGQFDNYHCKFSNLLIFGQALICGRDLLDRTLPRSYRRSPLLPIYQDARVRDCQSRCRRRPQSSAI